MSTTAEGFKPVERGARRCRADSVFPPSPSSLHRQAELSASYLPSLLRTVLGYQLELHPTDMYGFMLLLDSAVSASSLAGEGTIFARFVRLRPEETLQFFSAVKDKLLWIYEHKVSLESLRSSK